MILCVLHIKLACMETPHFMSDAKYTKAVFQSVGSLSGNSKSSH